MATKRSYFLKRLALIGIDLGKISVKMTFYGVIAALIFFLGAGFLVYQLPWSEGLVSYILIMLLVILWQIAHMLRVDREKNIRDGFEIEMEHFMDTHKVVSK